MKIERFFSRKLLITPILGIGILFDGQGSIKAQANTPSSKKTAAPLIIKPKTDQDSEPISISELKSGEESLRSSINLETNNGMNKLISEEDEEILRVLENPELLKITPIAIGKVVEISVPNEGSIEKEVKDDAPQTSLESTESTESLETLETVETVETLETLETLENTDPNEIDDKETGGLKVETKNESEDKSATADSEGIKQDESLEAEGDVILDPSLNPALNPSPNESLKNALDPDPSASEWNEELEKDIPTPPAPQDEKNQLTTEELDKILKPKYKELTNKIQKEVDKIKESGRVVTKQERETFKKQLEDGKNNIRDEYLSSQPKDNAQKTPTPRPKPTPATTIQPESKAESSENKQSETKPEIQGTMSGESEISSLNDLENF